MSKNDDFFHFSPERTHWSWQELLYGLENQIITRNDVVNYAAHILDEEISGFDLILKLAIADEYEDILSCLRELANLETYEEKEEIKDKWRYLILKELHDNQTDKDQLNEKVEEIYADFDYPEDMIRFIRYMPSTDGKSMEESWQEYLIKSEKRFFLKIISN